MTGCMVAVEDDFTSGPGNNSTTVTHSSTFEMNPNHSSGSTSSSSSYVPGFYAGPGPGSFGPTGGYPGGPMSPYSAPPAPISPYANQNQGAPNGGGAPPPGQQSLYGNQNSPLYNQNQQSSSYSGPGPGSYIHPGQGSLQPGYYNNHSPTHQFQYGGGQPPLRHPSPPPLGMPMMGSRIPHPTMNSPNQNVVTGSQMKTESMDLKPGNSGNMYSHPAPSSQGYSGSSYGYNGYPAASRPLMSPMSPHGRLNISPGGPNLSPREAPGPNLSPHPSLYSGQQPSPGPGHGQHHQPYNAQYSDYFNKMGPSPGYGGQTNIKEELPPDQRVASFHNDDKLSDVQSNASVRSGEDTPKHSSFCDDSSNPTLTNLVSVKKETGNEGQHGDPTDKNSSGDSDNENKFTPKSEPEDNKPPEGSYFEEQKDFTLKANQILIDTMNIDSIPEMPEIPELKYEDVSGMSSHNSQQSDKEAAGGALHHKGMSPEVKDGLGRWEEQSEEEGYHENMGWGHMQDGMDPGYQAHQMSYPNQQQMWANFYGSSSGPPGGDGGQGGQARYPPPLAQPGPPHMGMEPGWWQGHAPDMSGYRMPGPGIPPAPGPWALRGPRPRGERRGPGRPRLTNKGGPGGENRPRSAGLPGAQFPSPYPDGLPAEMMADHKRGPGRPKALLDPNSPKVPGDTTKNGNKKRYTCEVCQKRFSTAWYVRVHRRSHNGERPYVCNNCGKGFMLPNVLQVHLRKCEKNNPPVGGGGGSQPGQNTETDPPSQSPNQSASGPQGFPAGYPDGAGGPSLPPQQSGYPGMGGYNQRYLGGLGSPPFNPGMSGELPPMSGGHTGGYPGPEAPGQPQPGYLAQSVSPGLERPLYSPDTALPISSDSEQHHFLANDKPRDKGGGDRGPGDPSQAEDHIKTDRPFSCEMCDKRFSQKCNLVTHMRLHTGEKPYICEFCDKRFTQKGNLDAHIKTHTKEKPFQCSQCPGKRFAFKSSLQAHVRGHQNGNTCPEADMEDDDLESLKENVKMQDIDKNRTSDEEDDLEDNDPEGSLSMSPPPLPKFGATIQQFNSKELNSSPETDISKLSDSRQTVAMLQ